MIFLLPPNCGMRELFNFMARNQFNRYEELPSDAGMRRFKVWRVN
jgi:hypothetical protein